MKFDNDIFISYAHLDNQPLVADAEGWVSQFHRALEVRVDQLLGKKSSVWRDPKLQGNDVFDDTIVEQLPKVAVLVSVFSPRYVQSESCAKELTQFCLASERTGGLRLLDKSRIFKVLKTPVPLADHPEQVRDCLGYEFFKYESTSGRVRELNQVFGKQIEREFWIKLDDLAQDLCELLGWLHDGVPGTTTTSAYKMPETVYMADCSFDVANQHAGVKRDLLGHSYRVLPGRPLPHNVHELVPIVNESLDQSRLSVHVIGESYGIVPEGTDRSLIELQNDLAIKREERGEFSRIVWIPPDLQVEDERQKRFIESLRSDPRTQRGADLLETPLEDLNTQIHQLLAPAEAAEPDPTDPPDPDRRINVYLVCDARDRDNVTSIADYLFDQGYEVLLPAFSGDETEVRADHEENLKSADAILIYYGSPNELWLRGKLRELRKSAGQGRSRAYRAAAILLAPPNSQQDSWIRTHEASVIRQLNGFSSDLLDPFLTDLRS